MHRIVLVLSALAAAAASAATTGFWHVEKIDGRDWAIAPDGRPTVLAGVDWVWPAGFHCEALGYSPYGRFVETNYPSREAWADETADRLHSWGFNFLGSGCDNALLSPRGFAHAVMLNTGYRLAHDKDKEKAISPGLNRPGTAFPNVFHPDFEAAWDLAAARAAEKYRDDPNLLGYYLDNELSWAAGMGDRENGMFDAVAALPPEHSARKALDAFLAEWAEAHHKSIVEAAPSASVKVAFLSFVAERYFSVAAAAVRRHDPNHMVLGCRFAGIGAHEEVLKAAARHCDIVTFNLYPWADLDRGIVLTRKDGPPVADVLTDFHDKVGAPLLITEWSFSALDTGRPCSDGAGQRFRTQAERVEAAEMFARTLLSLPFMVGHAWFMWVDQPALGFNKYFHEDCNYGLVSEEGVPYAALTEMFARVHAEAGKWRIEPHCSQMANATNVHTSTMTIPESSEREKFFDAARKSFVAGAPSPADAVAFHQEADGAWSLSNGLVRLSGRIGSSSMVEEVARDGRVHGRCNALVMTTAPDWPPVTRLVSATPQEAPGGCRSVVLVGEGGEAARTEATLPVKGPAFAIAIRLTLAPSSPDILAEILSVRNLGATPLSVQKLFLCPFAAGDAPPERVPMPVNVWKGWNESWWRLADGARYGAVSHDESADGFNLWTEADGRQHADIPFRPLANPVTLAPGETLQAPRPMSALLRCIAE
ncbi:MAG: hypothetical protein IKH04_13165 [Kiritimatiellae bacterium]|nr:hypothetical protein [Kiritimatiellia bacterium]